MSLVSTYTDDRASTLRSRLEATHAGIVSQRWAITLCLAVTGVLVYLAAAAFVDFHWELARGLRVLVALGGVAGAAGGLFASYRNWISAFTVAQAAAWAEQRDGRLGQRLRTTLDYGQATPAPAPAAAPMIAALRSETEAAARAIDWERLIDRRGTLLGVALLGIVCLAWFLALLTVPELRTTAARLLLFPLEYTTVNVQPLEAVVKVGESVTIAAEVSGRPIQDAILRYRQRDAAPTSPVWKELPLLPPDLAASDRPRRVAGKLTATLVELQEDVEFQVVAGPRDLPFGQVRVLQPLTVEGVVAQITPPEYTGQPVATISAPEIKIWEGSRVELRIRFNRAPAEAKLSSQPAGKPEVNQAANGIEVEAAPVSSGPATRLEGQELVGVVEDVRQNQTLELTARSADGMDLEPVRIPLRVVLDQKPRLEFLEPTEQLEVLPTTEVNLRVGVGDDLGLHKVGILAQIGERPAEVLFEHDYQGAADPVEAGATLLLEKYSLTYQDGVTYHAFAEDNYFGAARRVTTPLRFIDIRPYERSYQRIEGGGSCNGCSTTLEELIARQRRNLAQTFVARHHSPLTAEVRQRLLTNQSEIHDATVELAAGLAERGLWVPDLDEAGRAMKQAVEALEQAAVETATAREQTALTHLIRARQNVRQMLKDSSSPSASACRKFDQQQRQKLRSPEQKKADQKQQVAELRSDLEKLASQQRQWSEDVRRSCSSSSSQSSPSNKPSNPPSTPKELREQQERMVAELEGLGARMEEASASSPAGREQARQAGESMQAGLRELDKQRGEQAAREGERSAEQLEQLSAHLNALQSGDFGGRLDAARQLAEQMAQRQADLAQRLQDGKLKSGDPPRAGESSKTPMDSAAGESADPQTWARDQRGVAQQADLLAERLAALHADAAGEKEGIGRTLDDVRKNQAPTEMAAGMRRTADDLQADRRAAAGQGAEQARRDAEQLARALGGLRQQYAQPQLQELLALEEQLAQLQRQLARAKKQNSTGGSAERWPEVAAKLAELAGGDRRIAEAIQRMAQRAGEQSGEKSGEKPGEGGKPSSGGPGKDAEQGGDERPQPGARLRPTPHRSSGAAETPPGFYSWRELGDFQGLPELTKVVQMKIQEAILAGAMQDADEPVPPEYRSLVDEYYRALSDDLSP